MMKKMSNFILVLIITLTTVLYGCGDGTNNEPSANDTSGEPTYGGSVVVGIQQDLDSLDPHLATGAGTREILFNVFEGLVKPDKDGNLVPAVASDYQVSEDSKVYTFALREGVKFHNGTQVTAEDVKYSIERCAGLLNEGDQPLDSSLAGVEAVNIKDESTVEIVLKEGDTEFICFMTSAIIPKGYADMSTNPIGTGPFKFSTYSAGQKLVVEKFGDYWKEGSPYLDQVEFRIVANTDSVLLDLKAGSIDIYAYLTSDQAAELESSMNILSGNANLVQALYLNNNVEPFSNVKVRQALSYAIDKQQILDMVAGGKGTLIGSSIFPGLSKYFDESLSTLYTQDIEKAKALLSEAGYPDGFTFTIRVPSNYQFHVDTAQVMIEQFKAVGVTAKLELVEWTTWLEDIYKGRNYEATLIGIDSTLAPKDIMMRYQSESSKNFFNYYSTHYDEVIANAVSQTDEAKKIQLYKEAQSILAEDAAAIYIQDSASLVAVNSKLGGYTFYPLYAQDLSCIYFKK